MNEGPVCRVRARLAVETALATAVLAVLPRPAEAQTAPAPQDLPAVVVPAPAAPKKALIRRAPVPARVATSAPARRRISAPASRPRSPVPVAPVEARTPAVPTGPHQTLGTTSTIGAPPPAFAGGQVAAGSRVGFLGNRDTMSTPFSQTSFTDKLIKDQQARTVSDVLLDDASVRPTLSPYLYQQNFVIRGFELNGRDIGYDGLYGLTNPRSAELTGVERVEVLHGPGAFLFGLPPTGGIAGVINLLPKRAGSTPVTDLGVDYLSDGNVAGSFDVGRRVGDQNQFGVRLNGTYQDGRTPLDFQNLQHGAFTGALDYEGDSFRASADVGYTHLEFDAPSPDISVLPGFAIPKAPSLTRNIAQRWERSDTDHVFGSGRVEYDIMPNWTVFAAAGASKTRESFLLSLPTITDTAGDLSSVTLNSGGRELQKTAEGGVRGTFDTGPVHHAVSLVGTAYWQGYPFASAIGYSTQSNLYAPVSSAPPPPGSLIRTPYPPSPPELYGVAGVDTMSVLDDRLELVGGARQQWVNQDSHSLTSSEIVSSYDQSALTPLGAIVIKPIKQLSVYASYAEGLSIGPTAPNTAVNAGQAFPPTVASQIETGVKLDYTTIGASAAVFQIEQQSSFTNPVTNIFGVTGQQVNQGVELNVFGTPYEGFRTIAGAQFIKGTLTKTEGGTFDGKEAPGVPHTQVSFSGEYDLPFLRGATVTGRVIYTGRQLYDLAGTQSIPSWTRLDLGARYVFDVRKQKITARFSVENVVGSTYWASTGDGELALGTPRTFKFSLAAEF